jgi:hypothetical protein
MKTPAFETSTAVAMAAVGLVCAVLTGVLVTVMSKPSGFEDRLAVLQTRTELAERMTQRNMAGVAEPLGACANGPSGQLQALKDQITAESTRLSLQPSAVETRIADLTERGVTPIGVKFEVSGSYQSALSLLSALSARRPMMFVDSVDLVSRTSNVTLSVQGRVFCVAS